MILYLKYSRRSTPSSSPYSEKVFQPSSVSKGKQSVETRSGILMGLSLSSKEAEGLLRRRFRHDIPQGVESLSKLNLGLNVLQDADFKNKHISLDPTFFLNHCQLILNNINKAHGYFVDALSLSIACRAGSASSNNRDYFRHKSRNNKNNGGSGLGNDGNDSSGGNGGRNGGSAWFGEEDDSEGGSVWSNLIGHISDQFVRLSRWFKKTIGWMTLKVDKAAELFTRRSRRYFISD